MWDAETIKARSALEEALRNRNLSQKVRDYADATLEVMNEMGAYARENPAQAAIELAYMLTPFADAAKTAVFGVRDVIGGRASLAGVALATATSATAEVAMAGIIGKSVKTGGKIIAAVGNKVTGKVCAGEVARIERALAGRAIRADAISQGSKLEFLAPGRVKFDGVEFRAVRDLSHLSEAELRGMLKGRNPVDIQGVRLDGHHYMQRYHREPGAFMVEIPDLAHCISNPIQHPLGTSGGLTASERLDWKKLRPKFNAERARTELLRRGLSE